MPTIQGGTFQAPILESPKKIDRVFGFDLDTVHFNIDGKETRITIEDVEELATISCCSCWDSFSACLMTCFKSRAEVEIQELFQEMFNKHAEYQRERTHSSKDDYIRAFLELRSKAIPEHGAMFDVRYHGDEVMFSFNGLRDISKPDAFVFEIPIKTSEASQYTSLVNYYIRSEERRLKETGIAPHPVGVGSEAPSSVISTELTTLRSAPPSEISTQIFIVDDDSMLASGYETMAESMEMSENLVSERVFLEPSRSSSEDRETFYV